MRHLVLLSLVLVADSPSGTLRMMAAAAGSILVLGQQGPVEAR